MKPLLCFLLALCLQGCVAREMHVHIHVRAKVETTPLLPLAH